MKNVGDAGFSRKRGGNAGSGPPLPDSAGRLLLLKKTSHKQRRGDVTFGWAVTFGF